MLLKLASALPLLLAACAQDRAAAADDEGAEEMSGAGTAPGAAIPNALQGRWASVEDDCPTATAAHTVVIDASHICSNGKCDRMQLISEETSKEGENVITLGYLDNEAAGMTFNLAKNGDEFTMFVLAGWSHPAGAYQRCG